MLTLSEIKNATLKDLQKALADARMKHHSITMAVRTQQSKSTHEPTLYKRYIARLLQQIGNLTKEQMSKKATEQENKGANKEAKEESKKAETAKA